MRKYLPALALMLVPFAFIGNAGAAAPLTLHFGPTVIFGNPGDVTVIVSTPTGDLAGRTGCAASFDGDNNPSVHPNTGLIVASASTVTRPSIEEVVGDPGPVHLGNINLGATIVLSLVVGSDGVISLNGGTVTVVCPEVTTVPPTTTPPTTAPSTTTPTVPTTRPPTMVPLSPPVVVVPPKFTG